MPAYRFLIHGEISRQNCCILLLLKVMLNKVDKPVRLNYIKNKLKKNKPRWEGKKWSKQ